ncbi:MAG: D-lyxose/D-mannose family sugar isomerase [Ignavibacteria bacterium]|nr:D-lyxose/D-mannose family sugar isomerase [Ignavibacteria bacterium]
MKLEQVISAQQKAIEYLNKANIVLSEKEKQNIEIADFGLNDLDNIGLEVVVYENNDRYCAKELVLFPRQICPEHRHPPINEKNIGKQETFRCRWGEVYLYTEGEPTKNPKAIVPEKYKQYLNVWNEIILKPGDQFTLPPNTLHWFQAGDEGAIVSEFSSTSIDEADVFTDPNIKRTPTIED